MPNAIKRPNSGILSHLITLWVAIPGTDVMILKIFSPKNMQKMRF
jgi:hypothetical protein